MWLCFGVAFVLSCPILAAVAFVTHFVDLWDCVLGYHVLYRMKVRSDSWGRMLIGMITLEERAKSVGGGYFCPENLFTFFIILLQNPPI